MTDRHHGQAQPDEGRADPVNRGRTGRLAAGDAGPTQGESSHVLAVGHGFVVEQILSGRLNTTTDYLQDHDEWVVLLEGGAILDVADVRHTLTPGDWLLLPAGLPHRLVSTEPATSWLAVRGTPPR